MSFTLALEALRVAGVPFEIRKGAPSIEELPPDGEVDLWIEPADLSVADMALRSVGFVPVSAPGQGAHRFYLELEQGRWRKLDLKLRGVRQRRGTARKLIARRPLSMHRTGPVIALVGPDGAGKGTMVAELLRRIPVGVTAVYLGGRRRSAGARAEPSRGSRVAAGPRELAFVLRKWLRPLSTLARAYPAAWRGHIVVCDRHPLEVLATTPDRSARAAALERFLATRLTPRPDAVVVLDAPAEVLIARKPEHSLGTLEALRASYREVFGPMGATFVDTRMPLESTVGRVSEAVWSALMVRRGERVIGPGRRP